MYYQYVLHQALD